MIVDQNGNIKIDRLGLTIGPDFTFVRLKLNKLIFNPRYKDFQDRGRKHYRIKGIALDNLPFSAVLYFFGDHLSQLHITCEEVLGNHEPPYTREEIELTKKRHDELLITEHGATSKLHPWGLIRSYLDDIHGYPGSAFIGIRYNTPDNQGYINIYKRQNNL
jgi:hypothetical protein